MLPVALGAGDRAASLGVRQARRRSSTPRAHLQRSDGRIHGRVLASDSAVSPTPRRKAMPRDSARAGRGVVVSEGRDEPRTGRNRGHAPDRDRAHRRDHGVRAQTIGVSLAGPWCVAGCRPMERGRPAGVRTRGPQGDGRGIGMGMGDQALPRHRGALRPELTPWVCRSSRAPGLAATLWRPVSRLRRCGRHKRQRPAPGEPGRPDRPKPNNDTGGEFASGVAEP